LQEADPTSRKRSRDALRKVALGTNFLIVGIENQEEMDYELALRNMIYDAADYEKQLVKIQKEIRSEKGLTAGEYLYGFRKDSKLNPLATFILYAGKEPWDGPTCLHDMLDFSEVPEELQRIVADYKINVIDIHQFENTDVFQSDLKQVFDFIRCSDDKKKLLDLVENDTYYKEMDEDAFDVVTKYTNSKELVKAKEYTTNGGKNDMCKAIQDLMDDSMEKGIEKGIEKALTSAIKKKMEKNKSIEQISEDLEISIEEVKKYVCVIQEENL